MRVALFLLALQGVHVVAEEDDVAGAAGEDLGLGAPVGAGGHLEVPGAFDQVEAGAGADGLAAQREIGVLVEGGGREAVARLTDIGAEEAGEVARGALPPGR
ncbi:hypothetical protein GCM10022227_34600 [Streptomyces sedi]